MTIIDANLDRIASDCKLRQRKRNITPSILVITLLRTLGCDQVNGLANGTGGISDRVQVVRIRV